MKDPLILHDQTIEWSEDMKLLFEEVESGKLTLAEVMPMFTLPNGQPLQSLIMMFSMLIGYRHFGQQTFVVGPRLREMFEHTSLQGVPWDAIRIPYDFFYIALPDCPHNLWGGPTGWHQLTGIVVGFTPDREKMAVYMWGAENEKSRIPGDDASFWFEVPIHHTKGMDLETYIDDMMRDPKANWSDGNQVSVDHSDVQGWMASAEYSRQGPADEYAIENAKVALRIIVNLCVYLQSAGAEQAGHPKFEGIPSERKKLKDELGRKKNPNKKNARNLQRNLDKLSNARVTWLGRTIEERYQTTSGEGSGQRSRHWVKGHWYPRLDNKKARAQIPLRWVQPYERNRESVGAQSRHYKFKGENDAGSGG